MQVIHKFDDFFYTIFPQLNSESSDNEIIEVLSVYYSYKGNKPEVIINQSYKPK